MTETWRGLGSLLFLFGVAGVGLELVLLGHYEDPAQWTPLALLGLGFVSGTLALLRPSRPVVRLYRWVAGAFVIAAAVGIYFHLKANVEFELELRPSMAGLELAIESLRGAMPALAPGAMAQLGLLGLLTTFKHPSLDAPGRSSRSS
jgi:hypothetical protein